MGAKPSLIKLTYIYIYMLAIAGRTAGPNWLTFVEETHWNSGVTKAKFCILLKFEISKSFKYFFLISRATLRAHELVVYIRMDGYTRRDRTIQDNTGPKLTDHTDRHGILNHNLR